jgi:hypothetical protein
MAIGSGTMVKHWPRHVNVKGSYLGAATDIEIEKMTKGFLNVIFLCVQIFLLFSFPRCQWQLESNPQSSDHELVVLPLRCSCFKPVEPVKPAKLMKPVKLAKLMKHA